MSDFKEADLLRMLVNLYGRVAFPRQELVRIISPVNRGRDKAIHAYNLCDGTRTQIEIATTSKIDVGNFNRMVKRWIEAGIVHSVSKGKSAKLLHVYPVSNEIIEEEAT